MRQMHQTPLSSIRALPKRLLSATRARSARCAVALPLVGTLLGACAGTQPSEQAAPAETSAAPGTQHEAPGDPCAGVPAEAGAYVAATSPTAGAVLSPPFEVAGCSRTFESNVVWRLLRRDGQVAAEGFTTGGGIGGPGVFRFVVEGVEGPSGIYHLEVSEPVVSEEEGFPPGRTVLPLFLELGPSAAASSPPAGGSGIEGVEWRLVSLGPSRPVAEGVEITARFDNGNVAGTSGCNRYTGSYTLSDAGAVSFGPLAGTRMACPPPAGDLEQEYLQALDAARTLRVADGRLIVDVRAEGLGPLTFERDR